jgi:hypothetical protein
MKVTCPTCQQPIDADQINVATDVAFCRRCDEAFSLAALVAAGEVDDGELGEPPKGCWFRSDFNEWEAGATTRSYGAWFLVPFVCIWSGGTLGGIYGSQIINGEFDPGLSLFGIPFVLGMLLFSWFAVMTVCGKALLRVRDDQAMTFVGVGSIGWRRRFEWSQITRVGEAVASVNDSGQPSKVIRLEGAGKLIQFGWGVNDERRAFLVRLLRRMLVKTKH